MEHAAPDTPLLRPSSAWRTWVRRTLFERTLHRIPRNDRVLDLCCGHGMYFSINPAAKGIDGDPHCVAGLRGRGYDVMLGDVLQPLPYADGAFEHVLAHDAFEHFHEHELDALMGEIRRVLRSAGLLIVWVPNRRGFDFGCTPEIGHKTFITAEVIHRLAGDAFDVVAEYAEPLPRSLGARFTHNKEVFHLRAR